MIMKGLFDRKPVQTKNGKWKEFNKHAVLISEGHYVNNKKHGLWREYYDSTGSLMIEEDYWHGVQHGRFASYHPNGQLLSEGEFQNGSREGCFKVYDESGANIRNIIFANDKEVEEVGRGKLAEATTGATSI
jgi:antitoxin component YwqK of YwqJK toxin-antitoxin module